MGIFKETEIFLHRQQVTCINLWSRYCLHTRVAFVGDNGAVSQLPN